MSIDALRNAALRGDSRACLQLAMAWMTGQGVPQQDTDKGRGWLEKAAANGNVEAMRFLGMIFLRGMDVVPDYERAVEYLEDAGRQNDHEAEWVLAGFLGGARDDWYDQEKSLYWLKRAATAGMARAQCHLAYCLQKGVLVPSDQEAAIGWYIKAAAGGDAGALLALAEYYLAGFMLPADPSKAYGLARAAADKGWVVAGEVAAALQKEGSGGHMRLPQLLPRLEEVSFDHNGSLPVIRPDMISWRPRVQCMRNFLSVFECAEIANAAQQHLMPSFIVDGDGALAKHQVRTSHEVRLRPGLRNIVIQAVEQRMAVWSHFPVENGEFPLILHYENSQSFEQHYDYFIPENFVMGEGPLEFGGQRVATQLIYLNQEFEGGETRFDRTELVVRPERGMCLLFFNTTPCGNVDPLTRHTGVGVKSGVKWLLSRWIREHPSDQPAGKISRDEYLKSS